IGAARPGTERALASRWVYHLQIEPARGISSGKKSSANTALLLLLSSRLTAADPSLGCGFRNQFPGSTRPATPAARAGNSWTVFKLILRDLAVAGCDIGHGR